MRAELPVFSFLPIFLFVLVLPGQVKSTSIPAISIISWLITCSIIHGTNSILWAGNVDVHAPIWCDIVSEVILGGMVAVPGAFLCVARRLDFASSKNSTMTRTRHTIFEVLICIVLPIVYMALHPLVQDHRFDIVQDFGCVAATYNSLLALLLVRLPPFLLSAIALIYCLSASWNVYRNHRNSNPLFPAAPTMTISLFIRRTVFISLGMLYVAVIYLFIITQTTQTDLDSIPPLSQVRAHVSEIDVPQLSHVALVQVELVWWAVPVLSISMCMLSALGEETRKGYRTMINWFSQRFVGRDVLPLHSAFDDASMGAPTTPIHLLRSGWDNDLNTKSSFTSLTSTVTSKRKPVSYISTADSVLPPNDTVSTASRTTTPSSPVSPELEASFTESTLNYLESNTAKQLRLPSPPPATSTHDNVSFPLSIDTSFLNETGHRSLLVPPSHLTDVPEGASVISAVAWPEPPRQIPSPASPSSPFREHTTASTHPYSSALPVLPQVHEKPRAPSPTGTSVSDFLDTYAYLPHVTDAPFSNIGPSVMNVPIKPSLRRTGSNASMKKNIGRARSPLTAGKGHQVGKNSKGEVIYMTVVKEVDSDA